MKQAVDSFYETAVEFCEFIGQNMITLETVDYLISSLMTLYIKALALPNIEPDSLGSVCEPLPKPFQVRIDRQVPSVYWMVCDPLEGEDLAAGSLYDDLSDILCDLRSGIEEYEAGMIGNAVFEWRFGLDAHWGSHAVDLIRVLHALRTGS